MVFWNSRKTTFHGLLWIDLATVLTLFLPTCLLFPAPVPNLPLLTNLPVEDPIDCSRNNNHASAFIRIKIYKFYSLIMYSIVRWHQKPVTWNRKAQRKTKVCTLGRSVLTVTFFFLSLFVFLMCLTLHALNYPLDLPFALLQSLEGPASQLNLAASI